MKKFLAIIIPLLICISANAADKDSTIYYSLPDSIKATSFMAEINVQSVNDRKEVFAGISTDMVKLSLEADKKKREIVFEYPSTASVVASGVNVETDEKGEMEWDYDWSLNETYKLMVQVATDSAANFMLYSGYCWLPKENKWKLIGTCRINGQWKTIQQPGFFFTTGKKNPIQATAEQVWCQRIRGSWKNLAGGEVVPPKVMLASHIDSLQQFSIEKEIIEKAIAAGTTDVKENVEGVYYAMMKEGSGKTVSIKDEVTIYYKGYLFSDGTIFDETKDKPATFPLNRLIRGWQVGLPLCKVGGKIKLVIPSAMAYSIRTASPKIPPNSILVFEIEVVDVKSSQ